MSRSSENNDPLFRKRLEADAPFHEGACIREQADREAVERERETTISGLRSS